MELTEIGYGLSGVLGGGTVIIGARFLAPPRAAAAGFGIATDEGGGPSDPHLAVTGVHDISLGAVVFLLLAARSPRILGGYMIATSIIPIGDGTIVRRGTGSKATAFGVHGATAATMVANGGLLLSGPR